MDGVASICRNGVIQSLGVNARAVPKNGCLACIPVISRRLAQLLCFSVLFSGKIVPGEGSSPDTGTVIVLKCLIGTSKEITLGSNCKHFALCSRSIDRKTIDFNLAYKLSRSITSCRRENKDSISMEHRQKPLSLEKKFLLGSSN